MQPTTKRGLQVIFDVHQYRLYPQDEQLLRDKLDGIDRQVEHFPVADLHVLIEGNARSNGVSVKLSLILPGTTLVTTETDGVPQPAFERCLISLLGSLRAYKDQLGQVSERQKVEKGTHQDLHPSVNVDMAAIDAAVEAGDYVSFRTATLPFEDLVEKRAGRWVQRYPDFEACIGKDVLLADVVEEVFLIAFDEYEERPHGVAFGDWLENLIDPAIKALQTRRDEELENISLARTARISEQGRGTV